MAATRAANGGTWHGTAARTPGITSSVVTQGAAVTKDEEIAQITAQIDAILDQLRGNVAGLTQILTRHSTPDSGEKRREADVT